MITKAQEAKRLVFQDVNFDVLAIAITSIAPEDRNNTTIQLLFCHSSIKYFGVISLVRIILIQG
jgi:hypothetical protein